MTATILTVLKMSITSSLVILAVILVRSFLRRLPKIFSYALWFIVLFRLLCPFTVETPISVVPKINFDKTAHSIQNIKNNENTVDLVHTDIPTQNQGTTDFFSNTGNVSPQSVKTEKSLFELDNILLLVGYAWLLGVIIFIVYSIVTLMTLRQSITGAMPLGKNIYLADYIATPFVYGIFRPRIYFPSYLSENEREYIILHEKTHINRGDHIVKLFAYASLCIHWFNPLVWLAYRLISKDMEMSCDEAVLKKIDNNARAEYSELLLRFSVGVNMFSVTPISFGESETKDRIKNIMNYKKPALWITILAILICIISAICLISEPYNNTNYTVFGKQYTATDVIYQDTRLSHGYTAHSIKPSFEIDSSGTAFIKHYTFIASGTGLGNFGSEELGKLKKVNLTKKNFDNYFRADIKAWSGEETSEKIRKNNKSAWEFIYENNSGYSAYFLLQNNNDMYAVLWYADPERENDEHSDDSFVRYMFKIEESALNDTSVQLFNFSENEIYSYYDSVERLFKPTIVLSKKDNTFQFTYSLFSSHIGMGTYELTDEYLTLYDENNTYVLKVVGEDFMFDAQKSSPIPKFRYSADSYEAQSPVPDGAVFSRSVAQSYIEAHDVPVIERDTLDEAVGRAVLTEYGAKIPDGLIHAESHIILKEEKLSPTPLSSENAPISNYVIAYTVFMHRTYSVSGGTIETVDSVTSPAKLTFEIRYTNDVPDYTLTSFITAHSNNEIMDVFPDDIEEEALSYEKYHAELLIKTNQKAIDSFNRVTK